MAQFKWLGGVDEGAQAIKGFTVVAGRLTDVVEGFAADARLQTQLLLLETEDLETVKKTAASLERISKSSERLAATAEKLPAELRRELTAALDEVDAKQPELRKTLSETRALVDRLEPTGKSVADAGEAWRGTAKAIEEMVASFRTSGSTAPQGSPRSVGAIGASETSRPEKESPPYDINDYRRAAEAIRQTAKEMQTLVTDLRGLGDSGAVAQRGGISRNSKAC
jgi:hypothetical protein